VSSGGSPLDNSTGEAVDRVVERLEGVIRSIGRLRPPGVVAKFVVIVIV